MVVNAIAKIVQRLFLSIIASCKKAACFLQRRRKNSGTLLPLHAPSITSTSLVLPDEGLPLPAKSPPIERLEEVLQPWTGWSSDGFEAQSLLGVVQVAPDHPDSDAAVVDYFRDMTPTIRKPAKIVLKKKEEEFQDVRSPLSRLSFKDVTAVALEGAELGAWDDSENAWEEEDLSGEMTVAARERRRIERERRLVEHQQKKVDKEIKKGVPSSRREPATMLIATKLS